ncbi:MAG TPA: TPM domain-containing protein [Candidatus Dormibacteraeota bacterium]|nr:TPM domain-containing protein [Candidatus Dormibacteraeota bacterium]
MTKDDRKRIDEALHRAEAGTSSRIAVRVVPDATIDAFERAKAEFLAGGMHVHPGANAALILVAPKARSFAVLGDRALHERVGQPFWERIVAQMTAAFKTGTPTDAIVLGVDRLGDALHEHFKQAAP